MTSILNELVDLRVEFAFGADLSADPDTWDWTRVSGERGRNGLQVTGPGSFASTPHQPMFSIPNHLTIVLWNVASATWNLQGHLAGQGGAADGWRLEWSVVQSRLRLRLANAVTKEMAWTPPASGVPVSLRVEYDRIGAVTRFWEATDGDWELIGSITSGLHPFVPASADPLQVGGQTSAPNFTMTVGAFELRNGGPDGTVVASPEFDRQTISTTSFADGQDNTWSFTGDAQIVRVQETTTGKILGQTVSVKRGRADEASQTQPAAVSFELDNLTGEFTPGNPLSPHYPYVRRGVPCRVSVRWERLWRHRFYGQVDAWELSWPWGDLSGPATPGESRVAVSASAFTRRLGQSPAVSSSLFRAITGQINDPTAGSHILAYWPLEEGPAADSGTSPIPGVGPFLPGGGFEFAGVNTLPASKPLLLAESGQGFGFNAVPPPGPDGSWGVEFECFLGAPLGDTTAFMTVTAPFPNTDHHWDICATAANQWRLRRFTNEGTLLTDVTTPMGSPPSGGDSFYDLWFRMQLRRTAAGGVELFWAAADFPATVHEWQAFSGPVPHGTITRLSALFGAPNGGVAYGHVVVHDGTLSLLADANAAHEGERAADRYQRLCDENAVPCMTIAGEGVRMGPQSIAPIMDLLEECVAADSGVATDAVNAFALRYRPRTSLYNQEPSLILDAALNQIANPLQPVLDDQRFANDVTVSIPNAGSATAFDQASIDAEGRYDESVTLNLASEPEAAQAAGWRLHLGLANGEMRTAQVAVDLTIATEIIDAWLGLDAGDRLHVENLPPQYPLNTLDLLVQGTTEQISPFRWTVGMNATPYAPWIIGHFHDPSNPDQIGGSKIDTDGSELDTAVDETATSLTVVTTAGNPWTTDPGDFPFDLLVDGERMTVTAISSVTSPQTFTVTRGVNGIVKPHPAGASVGLADPCVIGW